MVKIKVDKVICAGHAMCAAKAPEVYEVDEEGYCSSDGKVVPIELLRQAELGAMSCPEGALQIIDDEEGDDKPGIESSISSSIVSQK